MGIAIFVVTYLLVSARRLRLLGFDRPAIALAGAVACVALGALTPEAALAAVDSATLLLLFGVMGMGAFLAVDGFFDQVETQLVAWARTPRRLLGMIVWGAGMLSAAITNDAVCVLGAPVVVRIVREHRLPATPFLLALATAANTGSVATLVGNPQNMLCGLLGGLVYREFLLVMAPVAVLGLALNHLILGLLFREPLRSATLTPPRRVEPISRAARMSLGVVFLTSIAYALGANLAWAAAAGFVALMLLHRRDTRELWPRIDWTLLLFFAGLFVVVAALEKSGAPAAFFARFPLAEHGQGLADGFWLSGIFLVGSNLVSNVPFILVVRDQVNALGDATLGWQLLAMASTFAGNLTLLGSVANIIVAETARDVGGLGFWQHLKAGLPIALATTIVGTLWVVTLAGAS
ncbi:MAG TPA: SLC13 family permease [Polyangiaceae bacterium]